MKIYSLVCLLLISFLVPLTAPNAATAESLEDAWAISLNADHLLKASEESLEAARFDVKAAKSARWPKVNLYSGYTFLSDEPAGDFNGMNIVTSQDQFLSYHATVSVPIYTHFQITNGIRSAQSNLEATGFEKKILEQNIKLKVAEAYIGVLLSQKNVDVAASHVTSLAAIAEDIKNLHDQGMVAINDLLAAQVSLADARQKKLNARNQLDTARSAYNRILVRPMDTPVDLEAIEFKAPPDSLETLADQALHTRAELKLLGKHFDALKQSAAAEKAAIGPHVQISGGNEYTENEHQVHEDLWSANISLSWDIFDGNIARNKSSAILKRADSILEKQKDVESTIRLNVRSAWLKMKESQDRIQVAKEALNQAEENLNVSRNRYQEGVGTNTDVLNAEALRLTSRVNFENAYYDFGLSIMRLKRAIGEI